MSSGFINQQEAKRTIREYANSFTDSMFATSGDCNLAKVVALECASIVANMPAVDAQPVVYCKDCKYWHEKKSDLTIRNGVCERIKCTSSYISYCSSGEKMDGDKYGK